MSTEQRENFDPRPRKNPRIAASSSSSAFVLDRSGPVQTAGNGLQSAHAKCPIRASHNLFGRSSKLLNTGGSAEARGTSPNPDSPTHAPVHRLLEPRIRGQACAEPSTARPVFGAWHGECSGRHQRAAAGAGLLAIAKPLRANITVCNRSNRQPPTHSRVSREETHSGSGSEP